LWKKLKEKERVGLAGMNPPVPLIFEAWWDTVPITQENHRLIDYINL
jgi:hypothetical protein